MRLSRFFPAANILFPLMLGFAPLASPAAEVLPPPVADALVRNAIPMQSVGVYVQEVGGPLPLMAWNAQAGFNPASTMKLVTTDAALEMLGPAFTWKTRAYTRGTLNGDVLQGDLIIR